VAKGIPARLNPAQGRRFGLVVGAAFLVLGAVFLWRDRLLAAQVCGALGGALVLLGLVLPRALLPVERVWMSAALAISKVTTPVLLGLIYFGVITPIGGIRRLFARDPLRHPLRDGSLWIRRETDGRQPRDMERQF
jgi:saxitoxin biosynthesis operon SxtJ-like protein